MPCECIAHGAEVIRTSLDCSKLQYCAKANPGLTRKSTAIRLLETSKHLTDLTAFSPLASQPALLLVV